MKISLILIRPSTPSTNNMETIPEKPEIVNLNFTPTIQAEAPIAILTMFSKGTPKKPLKTAQLW
jgi:hypothetical protein